MLPTLIHKQIDAQDELEERLSKAIDLIISNIDIKKLIADPQEELNAVVQKVSEEVEDVAPEAMENGVDFAEKIKKMQEQDKDLVVGSGEDPQENKEEVEDGRQD